MYDHTMEYYASINIMFVKNLKLFSDIGTLTIHWNKISRKQNYKNGINLIGKCDFMHRKKYWKELYQNINHV